MYRVRLESWTRRGDRGPLEPRWLLITKCGSEDRQRQKIVTLATVHDSLYSESNQKRTFRLSDWLSKDNAVTCGRNRGSRVN